MPLDPIDVGLEAKAQAGLTSILDDVVAFVRRYIVMTEPQAIAVALWIAHTHAFDAADVTPYLNVSSAEKRSGKTRLLDVLELLVARSWRAVTPTEAVVFRKIAADRPTFLLDEVDALYTPKATNHEGLRALLNAGHRSGTTVPRCVGEGAKIRVEEFEVFCPKALAGIGDLPDTVADRSIKIALKRQAPGERLERFRRRDVEAFAGPLRERLARWAEENIDALAEARPEVPDALDDRAADGWEPLLAIADLAGNHWPARACQAALELSTGDSREDDSLGVRLLADARRIFDERDVDRLATVELIDFLAVDKESDWADWRGTGNPVKPRSLARLLRPYGIRSRTIRLPGGETPKGFLREQFGDAWSRYLAPPPNAVKRHNATTGVGSGIEADSYPQHDPPVADLKEAPNPHEQRDVAHVADRNGSTGEEIGEEQIEQLLERHADIASGTPLSGESDEQ
jgi:hypothetical protein